MHVADHHLRSWEMIAPHPKSFHHLNAIIRSNPNPRNQIRIPILKPRNTIRFPLQNLSSVRHCSSDHQETRHSSHHFVHAPASISQSSSKLDQPKWSSWSILQPRQKLGLENLLDNHHHHNPLNNHHPFLPYSLINPLPSEWNPASPITAITWDSQNFQTVQTRNAYSNHFKKNVIQVLKISILIKCLIHLPESWNYEFWVFTKLKFYTVLKIFRADLLCLTWILILKFTLWSNKHILFRY